MAEHKKGASSSEHENKHGHHGQQASNQGQWKDNRGENAETKKTSDKSEGSCGSSCK